MLVQFGIIRYLGTCYKIRDLTMVLQNSYHGYMDPKSGQQLDPKLQEAYNKVMGVSLDTPATPPSPSSPTPPPTDTPTVVTPPTAPTPPQHPSVSEEPTMSPAPSEPSQELVTTPEPPIATMQSTISAKPQTFVAKKGMKISPVILIVGGIAFLLVYSLIWIKVFNLSIPFINQ